MAPAQPKIVRSKEEAEQMASVILAAHQSSPRTPSVQRQPARWKLTVACGLVTGIIVATLPSHSWVIGALTGLAIGGIAAMVGRAMQD